MAWSTSAQCRLSTCVPQGSALLFSLNACSLGKVISSHCFSHHCCAYDTQHILSFPFDTHVLAQLSVYLAGISLAETYFQQNWSSVHPWKDIPMSISCNLSGQLSDLAICYCKQPWGSHGQPTVFLTSRHYAAGPCYTTVQGSGHFYPQRPLRCWFGSLSFWHWITASYLWQVCAFSSLQLTQVAAPWIGSCIFPLLHSFYWIPVAVHIRS